VFRVVYVRTCPKHANLFCRVDSRVALKERSIAVECLFELYYLIEQTLALIVASTIYFLHNLIANIVNSLRYMLPLWN
jgi:hypothetical protein